MYPIMVNIEHKPVVVIGGGRVAARKIKSLLAEGAVVTVVSPKLLTEISREKINWLDRSYQTGDLKGAKLVFACTDDPQVNAQIMKDSDPSQMVNNTGDKINSDFYNVAITQKEGLSVMISTNGVSPSRSKEIRQKIEQFLEQF